MGSTFVHLNPTIFPQPNDFVPERWLGEEKAHLDQYIAAFSKGPRTCLGIKCVPSAPTVHCTSRLLMSARAKSRVVRAVPLLRVSIPQARDGAARYHVRLAVCTERQTVLIVVSRQRGRHGLPVPLDPDVYRTHASLQGEGSHRVMTGLGTSRWPGWVVSCHAVRGKERAYVYDARKYAPGTSAMCQVSLRCLGK